MSAVDKTPEKTIRMKIFAKGQVVIPAVLRKKYRIGIGDHVDVIETPQGILLKAAPVKGPSSKTDRLFGMFRSAAEKKPFPGKEDITRSVENGFTEGWDE